MNQQATINHQARRRHEDNLAVVFMGVVLVFLVTHALRVFLSLHETWVIQTAIICHKAGMAMFPGWAEMLSAFR